MKRARFIATLGATALIGAIGVGSTFAYLTSQTDAVTNTFSVGDVEISLDETDYDNPEGERVTENEYGNLVPGQTVVKDPTVHVEKDSVESYVFMTVEGVHYDEEHQILYTDDLKTDKINTAWTYVSETEGVLLFKHAPVPAATEEKDLEPLFGKVTVKEEVEESGELTPIIVKAYAIQKYGFENAESAAEELGL